MGASRDGLDRQRSFAIFRIRSPNISILKLVMDGAAVLDDNAARFGVRDYSIIRKHTAARGRYDDMGVSEMGMDARPARRLRSGKAQTC